MTQHGPSLDAMADRFRAGDILTRPVSEMETGPDGDSMDHAPGR
jgi:hypothetical protein